MSDLFPIIEVPEDATQETESLGTKFKFWFRQGQLDCLYKQASPVLGL
ncbi:MAG: HipA-like protein, partial [Okeania sp. SIO2H7]|nr:HipA-like protein [Okeania sp. SIO2H7]